MDCFGWSRPVALMRLDLLNFGLFLKVSHEGQRGCLDCPLSAFELVVEAVFDVWVGCRVSQNGFNCSLVLLQDWQDCRPHCLRLTLVQAVDRRQYWLSDLSLAHVAHIGLG